jgi:hypothetical protein
LLHNELTFNRTRVPLRTDEYTAADGLIAHRMPRAPVTWIAGVIDFARESPRSLVTGWTARKPITVQ